MGIRTDRLGSLIVSQKSSELRLKTFRTLLHRHEAKNMRRTLNPCLPKPWLPV
jgi:hypothetical protein